MNISPGEPRMSPTAFVAKWLGSNFGEKQASQEMFLDICGVLGHASVCPVVDDLAFSLRPEIMTLIRTTLEGLNGYLQNVGGQEGVGQG